MDPRVSDMLVYRLRRQASSGASPEDMEIRLREILEAERLQKFASKVEHTDNTNNLLSVFAKERRHLNVV